MYGFFSSSETKKMPSISSSDFKSINKVKEEIKEEAKETVYIKPIYKDDENIIDILLLPENDNKRLILWEKYYPRNVWSVQRDGLKLSYGKHNGSSGKVMYSMQVYKHDKDNTLRFIMENGIVIKLSHKDNKFYITYLNVGDEYFIDFDNWEWRPI